MTEERRGEEKRREDGSTAADKGVNGERPPFRADGFSAQVSLITSDSG
jgi:hypothetical protein